MKQGDIVEMFKAGAKNAKRCDAACLDAPSKLNKARSSPLAAPPLLTPLPQPGMPTSVPHLLRSRNSGARPWPAPWDA